MCRFWTNTRSSQTRTSCVDFGQTQDHHEDKLITRSTQRQTQDHHKQGQDDENPQVYASNECDRDCEEDWREWGGAWLGNDHVQDPSGEQMTSEWARSQTLQKLTCNFKWWITYAIDRGQRLEGTMATNSYSMLNPTTTVPLVLQKKASRLR